MIVEVGHFALVLALAMAIVQSLVPLWGAARDDEAMARVGAPTAVAQCLLVTISFLALTWAYMTSDFSVENVVANSHSAKPLVYKISGVWGNHEGSMLLWVLILALFGAAAALFGRDMPLKLRANVLAVQGMVSVAFLLFILATSNPFARLVPAPAEGRDLNPLLQDPGLAIHPPLLYVGYVGFSIAFSFAAGALISGRIDAAWARWTRPWVMIAWIFLTLGIAMGSYWAYYELGWGGFWFWDPVENASLMPWLSGTALVHSIIVMEKRDALKVWTLFLAIVTFSLSLLGTFLVRSGVLTSVHSFATDPQRGVFILAILVIFIGGALALYAWRAPMLKQGGIFAPISREGALVLNNLLLSACTATVFVGTLYPLALEATTGEKISVGAPFFNLTFGPLFLPLLLIVPFGQALAWKRGDLAAVTQRLIFAGVAALILVGLLWAVTSGESVLAILGAGLALFVIVGSIGEVIGRVWRKGVSLPLALRRAVGLPLSAWGTAFAHAGLGVSLLGLAATGWGVEKIVTVKIGEIVPIAGYEVRVRALEPRAEANYSETVAAMDVLRDGVKIADITPSKRLYTTRQMPTTEAGIATIGFGQVYVALADDAGPDRVGMRLYWKPLVLLIWIGSLVMAFGGALSLADRRMRVGVARRAPARLAPAE
ncbi:MAG: heme lyase CcmF/NrfE family subunit [Methylobacteriaceae bacterium]|nr:heme lyase CcmF/NrfE family subunit [Methylobacteriaceae bacterium]